MKQSNPPIKPYISKRKRKLDASGVSDNDHSTRPVDPKTGCLSEGPDRGLEVVLPTKKLPGCTSYVRSRVVTKEITRSQQHDKPITSLQWNACRENVFVTSSLDKRIHIWHWYDRKLIIQRTINEHSEGVKDARWSADGTNMLTASLDKTSKMIDSETGMCKQTYTHNDMVTSAIFHGSNGQLFLTGTFSSGIYAWDVRQSKYIKRYQSLFGQVQDLLFLPDNDTFLSSSDVVRKNSLDKTVVAWDFKTTAVMSNQIYQEPFTCTTLRLHPLKKNFLVQSAGGYVVIFRCDKPWKMDKYKRFQGHAASGYHIGFDVTRDGRYLYSGDTNGDFCAYDYHTANILRKEKLFTSPCVTVSSSPHAVSATCFASWDGTVALWE